MLSQNLQLLHVFALMLLFYFLKIITNILWSSHSRRYHASCLFGLCDLTAHLKFIPKYLTLGPIFNTTIVTQI